MSEAAWAAGFFDGEGSTVLIRAKYHGKKGTSFYPTVRLQVVQSGDHAELILRRFRAALGGEGFIYGPRMYGGTKPRWEFKLSGYRAVLRAVRVLWPHLGPVKRDQARKAMAPVFEHYRTHVHGNRAVK